MASCKAAVIWLAESRTSSFRVDQISLIRGMSSTIPCRPNLVSRGIYVPAKNGSLSGVMIIVSGHPPLPVIIWQTDIYSISMSGRSSRSTFIETKALFMRVAILGSWNDSCAITWHQWQVEYPIDKKIGLFSFSAFWKASGSQGYQSTGLSACCRR